MLEDTLILNYSRVFWCGSKRGKLSPHDSHSLWETKSAGLEWSESFNYYHEIRYGYP